MLLPGIVTIHHHQDDGIFRKPSREKWEMQDTVSRGLVIGGNPKSHFFVTISFLDFGIWDIASSSLEASFILMTITTMWRIKRVMVADGERERGIRKTWWLFLLCTKHLTYSLLALLHNTLLSTLLRIHSVQGVFSHWYPPKKLKYGKPRLGESTLT